MDSECGGGNAKYGAGVVTSFFTRVALVMYLRRVCLAAAAAAAWEECTIGVEKLFN